MKPRLSPSHIATIMQWCGDAAEGAATINLAKRAAELTRLGVTPVRLDHAGQIERPPPYSTAWNTPAKTSDSIAAAFKEESDANGFAIGGLVFMPGRRFVSRLMFAPKARRQGTQAPAPNEQSEFRATVDSVVEAGLASKPEMKA